MVVPPNWKLVVVVVETVVDGLLLQLQKLQKLSVVVVAFLVKTAELFRV